MEEKGKWARRGVHVLGRRGSIDRMHVCVCVCKAACVWGGAEPRGNGDTKWWEAERGLAIHQNLRHHQYFNRYYVVATSGHPAGTTTPIRSYTPPRLSYIHTDRHLVCAGMCP